jgi:trehalose 2-sulfotransferase
MEITDLPRPERSYLVCATPRSGSTLLCKALEETGLAGHPEEFFEAKRETGCPARGSDYLWDAPGLDLQELLGDDPQPPAPDYSALHPGEDYREHLRRTLEWGTTDNGVFGAKIMWGHRADFLPLARSLPELHDLSERELLAALFPNVQYVWVRRGDTVRQAVSLWKAIQTQSWRADQAAGRTRGPVYHFEALHHVRRVLERNDTAWGRWFEERGLRPLELSYERIASDPATAVRAVLQLVGVEADIEDSAPREAPMRRQSDEISDDWVARYFRERRPAD